MADYNLGTAHGRIVIDLDDKGSDEAIRSMAELEAEVRRMSDRMRTFGDRMDQIDDRMERLADTIDSIDGDRFQELARQQMLAADQARRHDDENRRLRASLEAVGAVAGGAGSQGLNRLRAAGAGAVQVLASVDDQTRKTSFRVELFNYAANGLDKTFGRLNRTMEAFKANPLKEFADNGQPAMNMLNRLINRVTYAGMAIMSLGGIASGVGAVGLHTLGVAGAGAIQALTMMAGSALVLPAIIGNAALVMGTLKIATSGMGDAMKAAATGDVAKMNEAMKDMPPQMREVVTEVGKLAPMFKALKLDVQNRFWSEMGTRISALGRQYLPMVGTAMGRVADAFNSGMHDVIDFYQEATTIGQVNGILNNMGIATEAVTSRFGSLARIFHTVTAIGSEFLPRLANAFGASVDKVNAFVTSAEGIRKIRMWIESGIDAIGTFWRSLKNIGASLFNIMNIGKTSGGGFLQVLERMSLKLREFTESADGVRTISGIFGMIRSAADAIMPALLALAKVVGTQVAPGFIQFMNLVGPKLTPFIEKLGDGIARLMSATPELADIFNRLMDAIGPLLPTIGQVLADNIRFFALAVKLATPVVMALINAFTALPAPVQSAILGFLLVAPIFLKITFAILKFNAILGIVATVIGKSGILMSVFGIKADKAGKKFHTLRRIIATVSKPIGTLLSLGARLAKMQWLTSGLSKLIKIAGPLGKVAGAFTKFSRVASILRGVGTAAQFMLSFLNLSKFLAFFRHPIAASARMATAVAVAFKKMIVASGKWIAAQARAAAAATMHAARTAAAWLLSSIKAIAGWVAFEVRMLMIWLRTQIAAAIAALKSGLAWVMAGIRAAGAWVAMQVRALAAFLAVQLRAAVSAMSAALSWVAAGLRAAGAWVLFQIRAFAAFAAVYIRAVVASIQAALAWVAAGLRAAGAWVLFQIRAFAAFAAVYLRAVVASIQSALAWVAAGIRAAGAWVLFQVRAFAAFMAVQLRAAVSAVAAALAWISAGLRAAGAWVMMQVRAAIAFAMTAASAVSGAATATAAWLVAQARMAAGWLAMQVRALTSMAITVAGVVAGWVVMGTQALIQAGRMALAWLIALGPVGIVIGIVIALVVVIIMNWEKIKTWTIAAFTAVWTFIVSIWNQVKTAIIMAVAFIYTKIMYYWYLIQTGAALVWNAIKMVITVAIAYVRSIITATMQAISAIWNTGWNTIKTVAVTVWNAVKTAITTAINTVKSVITGAINIIKSIWQAGWNAVKTAVTTAFNAVRSAVSSGVAAVVGFVTGLASKIKNIFSNAGQWLIDAGRKIMDGLLAGIRAAWDKVAGFLSGLGAKIKSLKGPEKEDAKLLIDEGTAIIGGLQKGMQSRAAPMLDWVKGLASRITGQVNGSTIADKLKNVGQDAIAKLAQGLQTSEDKVRTVIERIRETLQKVGNVNIGTVLDKIKSVAGKSGVDLSAYLGGPPSDPEDRAPGYGPKPPPPPAAGGSGNTGRAGDTYNLYQTVPEGATVKQLSETVVHDLRHAGKGVYR